MNWPALDVDVGQWKRIAERSPTRVNVLLPDFTDVTMTSLSHGPCEVVERSRDVCPADHVDQAVVPPIQEARMRMSPRSGIGMRHLGL